MGGHARDAFRRVGSTNYGLFDIRMVREGVRVACYGKAVYRKAEVVQGPVAVPRVTSPARTATPAETWGAGTRSRREIPGAVKDKASGGPCFLWLLLPSFSFSFSSVVSATTIHIPRNRHPSPSGLFPNKQLLRSDIF